VIQSHSSEEKRKESSQQQKHINGLDLDICKKKKRLEIDKKNEYKNDESENEERDHLTK